jgi:hypothetical protein
VGAGELRHSEIYFAFPADERAFLQKALGAEGERGYIDRRVLQGSGLSREEAELFRSLQGHVLADDMYDYISKIELKVHEMVREALVLEFGEMETGWWRQGVAQEISILGTPYEILRTIEYGVPIPFQYRSGSSAPHGKRPTSRMEGAA